MMLATSLTPSLSIKSIGTPLTPKMHEQLRAAYASHPYVRGPVTLFSVKRAGNNRLHVTLLDGSEAYILHGTVVAERDNFGHVSWRDGGYGTRTTCAAINEALARWQCATRVRLQQGEIIEA